MYSSLFIFMSTILLRYSAIGKYHVVKAFPTVTLLKRTTSSSSKHTSNLESSVQLTRGESNELTRSLFSFRRKKPNTKVVTDIDDTVVSSGGINIFGITLGGIDNQYKRGQFYPGVIQFALEMSKSTGKQNLPPKVSVLTARAREFKFALALKATGKLCSAYRSIGELNGLKDWGIGEVYYGSVAEWILHNRKGIRKFRNFEIMMEQDTASGIDQYVLIGDTGEKDEEAGERIAKKYPQKMRAIFLHSVYNWRASQKKLKLETLPLDRQVNGVPILYFRTYVGAAIKAQRKNLISKDAVRRVAQQAVTELTQLDEGKGKFKLLQELKNKKFGGLKAQESQWKELLIDLNSSPFLRDLIPQTKLKLLENSKEASIENNQIKTPSKLRIPVLDI